MSTRYSTINNPTPIPDPFEAAQDNIETTFDSLIKKLEARRDQLLSELNTLRAEYQTKEEIRKKHVEELDKLIEFMQGADIQQDRIAQLQEGHLNKLKTERDEFRLDTPFPTFSFDKVQLLEMDTQIEKIGTWTDVAPYTKKLHPIKSVGGRGELKAPYGVATDDKGKVYVADLGNKRIQVMNAEGEFIREFGKRELVQPFGIALHKDRLFVSDYQTNTINKYNINSYKLDCKSKTPLNHPSGLVADDSGVYVADCQNNRIAVLRRTDLKSTGEIGKGKLVNPQDVKIHHNLVHVADCSESHNMHIFSKSGDLLNSISIRSGDKTVWTFLCFDNLNNILISDYHSKTIQVYSLGGQIVHSIECSYNPTGIAVTEENVIISVDYKNEKIFYF